MAEAATATRAPPGWARYVALFCAVYAGLEFGYTLAQDSWLGRLLIDGLTVHGAAFSANLLLPGAHAAASGHTLRTAFGQIDVQAGCEGTQAWFLLIAALLPMRATPRRKLAGAAAGAALIYGLNQLRVVALLAAMHWRPQWFEPLHVVVAPTLIVLAGGLFFLAWSGAADGRE